MLCCGRSDEAEAVGENATSDGVKRWKTNRMCWTQNYTQSVMRISQTTHKRLTRAGQNMSVFTACWEQPRDAFKACFCTVAAEHLCGTPWRQGDSVTQPSNPRPGGSGCAASSIVFTIVLLYSDYTLLPSLITATRCSQWDTGFWGGVFWYFVHCVFVSPSIFRAQKPVPPYFHIISRCFFCNEIAKGQLSFGERLSGRLW